MSMMLETQATRRSKPANSASCELPKRMTTISRATSSTKPGTPEPPSRRCSRSSLLEPRRAPYPIGRTRMKCPICRRPVEFDVTTMPFCSERCKDADLGNWAEEKYRIPAPLDEDGIQKLLDEESGGEGPG